MEALREHVLAHGCYSSEENLRIFQKWFLERPPLTFLGAARKYGITSKRLCDVGCAYGGMLVYSAPGSYGIEIEPYEVRFAKSIGLEVIDRDIVADVQRQLPFPFSHCLILKPNRSWTLASFRIVPGSGFFRNNPSIAGPMPS